MNLVIDASVAIKWFIDETGSTDAEALLLGPGRCAAPDWLKFEVAHVLFRASRRRVLPRAQVDVAMDKLVSSKLEFVEINKLFDGAFRIAGAHGGSIYDATYVALARDMAAELVTADLQMIAVARKAKVKARLIA